MLVYQRVVIVRYLFFFSPIVCWCLVIAGLPLGPRFDRRNMLEWVWGFVSRTQGATDDGEATNRSWSTLISQCRTMNCRSWADQATPWSLTNSHCGRLHNLLPVAGWQESQENALKLANEMRAAGTDIIYCSGLVPEKFAGLARHLGWILDDVWRVFRLAFCHGVSVCFPISTMVGMLSFNEAPKTGTATSLQYNSSDFHGCPGVPVPMKNLLRQHFPCCGHVGYLPVNNTWFGGPRGVGKTGLEAKQVFDDVMALEAAGCIAVEMECVPARVAAEITQRTKMLVFSMGSLARWPPLKQTKV